MSKSNPLASLIGNYGDSDDDSDEGTFYSVNSASHNPASRSLTALSSAHSLASQQASAAIHPPPIPHCPWSACYDESSGFTYYWNQQTNVVTWEAPPEYLLALKLAQQQLTSAGSTEVSAEEWQLYQQALAEKQNAQSKAMAKAAIMKSTKKPDKVVNNKIKNNKLNNKKRHHSEDDEGKIELITSYHNSDSESNDEAESPIKPVVTPKLPSKPPKVPNKKPKIKPSQVLEYGPTLPPNQNYSVPIGPEIPPEILNNQETAVNKEENAAKPKDEDQKSSKIIENDDSQDENTLLMKLKDKAKILENLGGEIPSDIKNIIEDEIRSKTSSPSISEANSKDDKCDINIDDLLEEIEKKELPKVVKSKKIDMFDEVINSNGSSARCSPKGDGTPPHDEVKPLFPSITSINEEPTKSLFPSSVNIKENETNKEVKEESTVIEEKKSVNVYLMNNIEPLENVNRKRLRISNSVLPERKKLDTPAYTTKYSQAIDGFNDERTGLGFSKEEEDVASPKNTISYGHGLTFTKGETLNEEKKDEDLDDLTDLVEAKLKYLNQLQPCILTPVQEMLVQMQTLVSAFRAGALTGAYWRRWAGAANRALMQHEAGAAPPGWTCTFLRSEGRYRYRRECDGLVQWEYPAAANMDMEICTTPPHPGVEDKEEPPSAPPLPLTPPPPPPAPPAPVVNEPPPTPPQVKWGARVSTPPPPTWNDPPPPGCDDLPPLPLESKQEIGDELLSFYNDIAEIDKQTSVPRVELELVSSSPEPTAHIEVKDRIKDKDKDIVKISKKKTKVKISTSMGLKHKSVSHLVAKWQQVAEEITSD